MRNNLSVKPFCYKDLELNALTNYSSFFYYISGFFRDTQLYRFFLVTLLINLVGLLYFYLKLKLCAWNKLEQFIGIC